MVQVEVSPSHAGSAPAKPKPNDTGSIALLLLLYTLQGVPMGLSGSMPLVLQARVSYKEQALFSMVSLPFSLKLFWAPIVDSVYWPRHGRRKSWLVPVQFACGALMLLGARPASAWAGEEPGVAPAVRPLTGFFFALYFLCATQDIAVDGWALTMLSAKNAGWQCPPSAAAGP